MLCRGATGLNFNPDGGRRAEQPGFVRRTMITKTRLRRNRRALNGRSAAALPFVTGNRYRTGTSGKERNDDDDMAFRNCTMGMAAVLLLIISVAVLPSRLLPRQGNAPISKDWGRELGDYGKPVVSYYALDDPAPPALGGDADRPFDCLIVGCGPGGGSDQRSLHWFYERLIRFWFRFTTKG